MSPGTPGEPAACPPPPGASGRSRRAGPRTARRARTPRHGRQILPYVTALEVAPGIPAALLLLGDHADPAALVAHEDVGAPLGVDRDGRWTGAVTRLVGVPDRVPVERGEPRPVVRGVDEPGLTGHGGAPGDEMGVAVGALADGEDGVQALRAADGARWVPGAAGPALRPAVDGGARQQVRTEPAVTTASEPFAVHRFTLIRSPAVIARGPGGCPRPVTAGGGRAGARRCR